MGNTCACSFTTLHWSVQQHLPLHLCSLLRASPWHLSFLLFPDCGHSIPAVVLPCQPKLFSPVHPRSYTPSTQYSMSLSSFLFALLQSALQTVIGLSFPHKFMTTFSKSSVTLFLLPFRKVQSWAWPWRSFTIRPFALFARLPLHQPHLSVWGSMKPKGIFPSLAVKNVAHEPSPDFTHLLSPCLSSSW